MAAADAERWDARYASGGREPTVARLPIALERAGAIAVADFPTSGTSLDVAAGLGAQTLWLAERACRCIHSTSPGRRRRR